MEAEIIKAIGIISLKYVDVVKELQALKVRHQNLKLLIDTDRPYTYSDYLELEDRTDRDLWCPKCNDYLGTGNYFNYKDIIDNHKCEE